MATIKESLVLEDRFSTVLGEVIKSLTAFNASLKDAKAENQGVQNELKNTQGELNNTGSAFTMASFKATAFGVAVGNIVANLIARISEIPGKVLAIGDSFIGTMAKLKMMNGELEEAVRMNDRIYEAAQRARSSYESMSANITRIGIVAKDTFKSQDELVAFTEIMSKSFGVMNATPAMISSSMLQISQALGSGRLQGDELRSIAEGAPLVLDALSKYMGVAKGDIRQLGADGKITAEILKNAVLAYGNEINAQFDQMPVTFSQAMERLQNKFMYTVGPMFAELSLAAGQTIMWINNNIVAIGAALLYVGMVITAVNIPAMISFAVSIGQATVAAITLAGAWLLMHWPVLIVTTAVFGLLAMMLKFPEVAGVLIGAMNVVKEVFMNALKYIAEPWIFVLNVILTGINKIRSLKGAPAIDLIKGSEYKNLGESYEEGKAAGIQYSKTASDKLAKLSESLDKYTKPGAMAVPGVPNIDEVGTVNKVKDGGTVKIYEEDLKLLKDVAMREFQLNYRQITPQIDIKFGDVRETADVNKIMEVVNDRIVELFDGDLGGSPA